MKGWTNGQMVRGGEGKGRDQSEGMGAAVGWGRASQNLQPLFGAFPPLTLSSRAGVPRIFPKNGPKCPRSVPIVLLCYYSNFGILRLFICPPPPSFVPISSQIPRGTLSPGAIVLNIVPSKHAPHRHSLLSTATLLFSPAEIQLTRPGAMAIMMMRRGREGGGDERHPPRGDRGRAMDQQQ